MNPYTSKEFHAIAHDWMRSANLKVNASFCRDEMNAHPDYPALTALTDFLESGGAEYDCVQADASYIREFKYPLLANITERGKSYFFKISSIEDWEKEKEVTKNWNGIVLYLSPGTAWNNLDNNSRQQTEFTEKLSVLLLCCAVAVAFVFAGLNTDSVLLKTFGWLSLAGTAISFFLFRMELGFNNSLVKQVCGTVSKNGCEKVLRSKYAKVIGGISPADAALIYFSTQSFSYLASVVFPGALTPVLWLTFAGLVTAMWSIYTQAFKIRQWCALCLGLAGILVLQTVFAIPFLLHASRPLTVAAVTPLLIAGITAPLIVIGKRSVAAAVRNKQEVLRFREWKKDPGLFISQLSGEQQVDNSLFTNDLIAGDPATPVRITAACGLFCGPCAKAHRKLDELAAKFPQYVHVQYRILCYPELVNDPVTSSFRKILEKNINGGEDADRLLTDWYNDLPNKKKTALSRHSEDQSLPADDVITETMQMHAQWAVESDIAFTPTIFINGRKLPGRYELEDLDKMIPGLAEAFCTA